MEETTAVYARNRKQWRSWLQKNHTSKKGVWLIYHKKHTGLTSVSYTDAVEESICFGWIDGRIKKIDDRNICSDTLPEHLKAGGPNLILKEQRK